MRRGPLVSFRTRCREAEPDCHVGSLVCNDCSILSRRNGSAAARSHRFLLPAIGPHARGSPLPLVRMIAATIAASFADAGAWYLSDFSRSPLSVRDRFQPTAVALTDTSAPTRSWQQYHSAPWSRDTHLVDKLSSTADEVSTQKQRVTMIFCRSHRNVALSCELSDLPPETSLLGN